MVTKKFFTKILIVLSASAILLAACGSPTVVKVGDLVPGDTNYETIKAQVLTGLVPGNADYENLKTQILTAQPTAQVCPAPADSTTCQPVVDTNPAMCSTQIATAQLAWVPDQAACQRAGYGYQAMILDLAKTFVEANGYYCYIPVTIAPTATPKPKIKREEPQPVPPVEPPCLTCPVPPTEEPLCATCPVPPSD